MWSKIGAPITEVLSLRRRQGNTQKPDVDIKNLEILFKLIIHKNDWRTASGDMLVIFIFVN